MFCVLAHATPAEEAFTALCAWCTPTHPQTPRRNVPAPEGFRDVTLCPARKAHRAVACPLLQLRITVRFLRKGQLRACISVFPEAPTVAAGALLCARHRAQARMLPAL